MKGRGMIADWTTRLARALTVGALTVGALTVGALTVGALAGGLVWSGCSGDAFVTSRSDVDEANDLLAQGDYEGALAAYDALESRNPRVAFDRGLALFNLKRWDEAVAAFDEVRASKDPAMKARSYYHIGNVWSQKALDTEAAGDKEGALEDWRKAVEAYENTLLIEPEHEDAKHQLEVALYRVDPPCKLRNDAAEENNSAETATAAELKASKEEGAAPGEARFEESFWLCPDDEDWFKMSMAKGDRFSATVARTEGPDYAKAALEVWSADGKTMLAPQDGERAETEALEIPADGEYRVRLANPDQDDFGVKLTVTVKPECRRIEAVADKHEPNDTLRAAEVVDAGKVEPLVLCPGGDDWFAVEVAEGESLRVRAKTQSLTGTLTLTLTDAEGAVLGQGKEGQENTIEALAYGRPAGPVFVHVSGSDDVEAIYGLETEIIPVCAKREDKNEENDSLEAAKDLTQGDHDGLQLCPGDDDWYRVAVKAGESVVAHIRGEALQGQPDVTVVDLAGKTLAKGFPLEGGRLALALDPGAGTYLVKVAGVNGAPTDATYDLKLQILPACPEGNDAQESNDSMADAKALELPEEGHGGPPGAPGAPGAGPGADQKPPKPKQKLLRICPGDQDWFRIPVTPETPLMSASIEFVHQKGDLALVEYEADGETRVMESDKSTVDRNGEMVVVPPPEKRIPDPTDFLLRIKGATEETQNFYLLTLKKLPPKGKDKNKNQKNQDKQDPKQKQDPQKQKQKQKQQAQKKEPRPDRSTLEKEMEKDDKNPRNLEAERARMRARHLPPPLKDW